MTNALIRKLSRFAELDGADIKALEELSSHARLRVADGDLIREGARPEFVFLLLEGWAYRYKLLKDGSRHILAYLIPGDLCDIHIYMLRQMDHNIGVLSDSQVVAIPPDALMAVMKNHPAIQQALWWGTLVDEATLREWLVNIGQRDAFQRIAHLFCELWLRMKAVGLVDAEDQFDLPLTQTEIADTMGLTPVHTNRMLQRLRADGLIALGKGRLTILDPKRLAFVSGFRPNYLHLGDDESLDPKVKARLEAFR